MEFVKVLTSNLVHRNYQWKIGRNDLPPNVKFNNKNACTNDALYICRIEHCLEWITLCPDIKWIAYATVPDDADTVVMRNKIKASSVVLHEPLISIVDFIPIAIAKGADMHAEKAVNTTAGEIFLWASSYGHTDIFCYIMDKYPQSKRVNTTAFQTASLYGCTKIIKYIIEKGIDVDVHANVEYAFRKASACGHFEIVQFLVEKCNVDIHADDSYALKWASYFHHSNVVNYLMEKGSKWPRITYHKLLLVPMDNNE